MFCCESNLRRHLFSFVQTYPSGHGISPCTQASKHTTKVRKSREPREPDCDHANGCNKWLLQPRVSGRLRRSTTSLVREKVKSTEARPVYAIKFSLFWLSPWETLEIHPLVVSTCCSKGSSLGPMVSPTIHAEKLSSVACLNP